MGFGDRYYQFLLQGDLKGAADFLDGLAGDERREAKAWFERSRVALVEKVWQDTRERAWRQGDLRPSAVAPWILALGPIALLGPVTAARKIPWPRLGWVHEDDAIEPFVVDRLCEKERVWAEAFVEEASAFRAGDSGHTLARVVRAVATHHKLPCPSGDTFLEHWSAGVGEMGWSRTNGWGTRGRDPVAWLSADPFMPDLLLRYLASGHCGSSSWLPDALPTLVERGKVDRDAIVQHVLAQLTSPQRPASQKVLVEILQALDLKAAEVQGGCAYFLGVIATSKGVVGKLFLPMALETLTGPEDLNELAAIIAGRSEKAQKTVLLNALKPDELRERVGVDAVRGVLEMLASGDDAALTHKAVAVLAKLPGGRSNVEEGAQEAFQASGLWELAPTPSGVVHEDWFHARNPSWTNVVDSRAYAAEMRRAPLIDLVLAAMADGSFKVEAALTEITAVLGGARLSMSTTIGVLRDLFLSGGLRQGYALALRTAETAAGLTTRPAGFADLLRLLSEFAVEIPASDRPAMPAALTAVAWSTGNTKARAEARVLGARLSGVPLETYVAGLSGTTASTAPAVRRGLWKKPAESTLAESRLPRVDGALARRLVDGQVTWWAHADVTGGFSTAHVARDPAQTPGLAFCGPDLLVAAVVRPVISAGVKKARKAVLDLYEGRPPTYARPEVSLVALTYWARGDIDATRFWELALSARTAEQLQHEFRQRQLTLSDSERQELQRQLFYGPDVIAYDGDGPRGEPVGLVLSASLNEPAARLDFLRNLEVLLLAERNPVVMATPVWADGTLDLDNLLARLRAAEGCPIGPLDLVQALHRLRPCDPSRIHDIEELANSGGTWRTAPALTTPGGAESWDVIELVGTWIGGGGLPSLEPQLAPDGTWSTSAVAPVPWAACAAAPAELRAGEWQIAKPSHVVPVARVFPMTPDRTIPAGGHGGGGAIGFPAEMSGRFERPLHDALVAMLVQGIENKDAASLGSACRAIRRGKVDPALFVLAVLAGFEQGNVKLERLAHATHHVFEQDGLAQFWDAALGAAEALTARPGTPAIGLAQLVEVLTAYAHEVPEPSVPPGLRAVAEAGGRTKLHQAVVTLVGSLEQGGSR
jgi:hypothetical protein